jgi:EmrB/QacA subfamily drug resistance transporter
MSDPKKAVATENGSSVTLRNGNNSSSFSQFAQKELPSRRFLVLIIAGLMTGMLLGAMDQTIVATAGPTIISDLGGLSLYAWVFSAYILTQTVSMPVFGKLSDLYGRKKFFMLGLVIFMVGSILSGAAQNIDQLIVFRAIQGIDSGAFFPVAVAVIGVTFPPRMRGRVQGIFASVFGIAAVVGPSAGSFIVQAISWRWVFYINLPLGVASFILINLGLKESRNLNARSVVDWLGISVLTGWVGLLILGFLDGGSTYSWYSWQEAAFFLGAATLFGLFIYIESKAKEPVLPLSLFRIRTVSSASSVAFLRGIAFFAIVTFVPLFVQAGRGGSIDDGRNVLNAMLIPLIGGTLLGGQLSTRTGYRKVTFAGLVIMVVGAYLMTFLTSTSSYVQVMESVAVLGLGVGITFPTVVIAIQYSVGRKQIGIASSLAQFMSNLGATIGLAILGSIQTNAFSAKLSSLLQSIPLPFRNQAAPFLSDANLVGRVLATPQAVAQLIRTNPAANAFIPNLRDAFVQSLIPIFWLGLAVSVAAVAASLFMTGSFKQQIAARDAAGKVEQEQLQQQQPEQQRNSEQGNTGGPPQVFPT